MNTKTKTKTAAEYSRQRARKAGRYAKHNPCELCGKSAGYNYFSHSWLDEKPFNGIGIVLCEKCCTKCEAAGKEGTAKLFGLEVPE